MRNLDYIAKLDNDFLLLFVQVKFISFHDETKYPQLYCELPFLASIHSLCVDIFSPLIRDIICHVLS